MFSPKQQAILRQLGFVKRPPTGNRGISRHWENYDYPSLDHLEIRVGAKGPLIEGCADTKGDKLLPKFWLGLGYVGAATSRHRTFPMLIAAIAAARLTTHNPTTS